MATGGRRDDAALVQGLARWMAARPDQVPSVAGAPGTAATIRSIAHADGGQANETVLVDLGPAGGRGRAPAAPRADLPGL